MSSTSSVLRTLLQTSRAQKLRGSANVWRLDGHDPEATRLRRSLLETASLCQHVIVHYTGDPPDEPSLKESRELEPQVWLLAQHPTADDLSSWLHMGNWQLYTRESALRQIPDLCRKGDAEVSRFVEQTRLEFIIDSFHDDDHWTIGVGQDSKDDA